MDRPASSAEQPDRDAPVIRVFGGVGLADADGPISIGGPRQRRLLALLAIRAGAAVEVDWLAEYLWDDEDRPGDVAPSVRTFVYRLRSAFPKDARDWIDTEPEAYRLTAPSEAIEHLRFGQLRTEAAEARDLQELADREHAWDAEANRQPAADQVRQDAGELVEQEQEGEREG